MFPINKVLRVIFDTNILAAALRSRNGASFQLISMIPSPKFVLSLSMPLYMEYLDVLMRPEIKPSGISDAEITDFVDEILLNAQTKTFIFCGDLG